MDTTVMYREPEAAVASRHPHTAGWLIRQSTKLRFNGKMGCLLILVLICTLLGNLDAAFNTRMPSRDPLTLVSSTK